MRHNTEPPALRVRGMEFAYPGGGFRLGIDALEVAVGERISLVGESGSGKTTLLLLVAGILSPDAGRIEACGAELGSLGDARRRAFRIARIGLVFQEFELLSYLTVLDNVLLPYRINRALRLTPEVRRRAADLLENTGLGDLATRLPRKLSHGQRQRVAVCRALIAQPQLILADEPTANLDRDNKRRVLDALDRHVRASNASLLIATHDDEIRSAMDRTIDVMGSPQASTEGGSHVR